ncbi:unnamed protein product [Polarella glacialis]|uniref:WW domain-containing protein n=1 Tax=Polarella glacialis TaxID=89957 RepID=A0A813G420_POLGL|nr:unnamed protein product [Polarella glacialis]
MRAIIESSEWCGLVSVRLGLVLTSVDGLMGSAEWTTEILPKSRIPTAAAVGVTEVHMSPQRIQGQPIPRLRLEVSTESDAEMIGFCTCNLTAPPLEDGTESRVLVSWYYGEIIGDIVPQLFSMTKVTNDESFSANILVLKMEGELMKPNAIWRFVARVSYAVHDEQQATQVPFTVRILPFQAPKAVAVGPSRINNDLCSFVIDARPSQLMEILYYSSNRRLDAGNAPEARLLQESIVMTTTRPLSEAKEQKLEFRWKVTQLAVGVDHAAEYTVVPASSMINEIAAQRTPELKISEAMLKEGLYVFTVFVSDAAIPGLESQASATVQIFRTEQPALTVIGPVGVLGPMDSATAKFQQIGFGMCPVPSASMDGPNPRASILLLRAPIGSPRRQLRAVAEVTIVISKKDMMGGNGNSLLMEGTAPPELLMPGYVYAYRLLLAEKDYASDLATFRTALIRAGIGDDAAPLQAAQRELAHEPTSIPSGIQVLDTDVFSIHSGPMAGTLDTMEPILRIGFAMQDLFRFQQIWVTDNPPLEFAYYYSEVPKDRAAAFQAELSNFFPDIGTDNRILDLVPPGSLVPLSDWSHDPTLATPLAEGMYVFEGRVRDAKGVESRKYAVVESVQAWQEEVVTSQDRLTLLDRYLKTSRQAILQVRALNRGAVSVVPVTAAVYGLPPLSEFNFKAMLDWNSSSTEPAPNRSQPIYGAPIVSRETRAEVVRYLHDIMSIFSDIVSALDAESLGAKPKVETRRLQDTNASLSNVTTPSHVEALSSAFSILASNIAPVLEPSLFVELGRLTADMLQRIRDARGDIRKAGNSPTELMTTISYLLAQTQPINKPREGVIVYNATEDVQARLSVEIVRATMLLGDVLGAITPVTAPPAQIRVAMPVGDYLNYKGGGDFVLTVASKTLNSIISEGVSTDPDYQSMERWMFPRIGITGLGAPGFMAQNWAGGADSPTPEYKESKCFGETEAFLERVQVLTVSWPINPFMYATGSLVGMNANVTLPYTVQLRSCGLPLVLSEQAGKVVLTFRLDPATVRDRRWGYADTIPYRVAWWEDIPGVGSQAERIRRWTTHGCKTEWVKSQEDMVQARCDRLPGITAGSVFVVELVPRPKYEVAPIPKANKNIHNVITYLMILFILRWTFLLVCAIHGDTKFWLTEKQNIKLLFLPAEFAWQDKARRGRLPLQEQAVYNPFSGAYWRQAGYVMKQRTLGLYCGYKALKGNELFYSAEVKELVGMRGGDRDGTYEHFVDSMNDKENAEKVSFAKEQRRGLQIAMAQMALPAPDDGFAGRRAAWPEAAALADSEGRWRSKSAGTERGMSDHGKGSKTSGGGSLRAASIGSGRHQAEAIQEVSGSNPVIGQGQTNQEAMTDAALQAAIFEGKVGQIPSDWEEYVSAEHGGRVFYVNGVTGVSSWEKPVLMADGSTQFEAESGEMINQPGRDPSKELPPLRGTSQKFGSLGRAVKAQRTLTAAPPEIEQAPNPSRSLKPDAMHRAAPPEDDEDDEDERTAVERESEVPAHRRLPLLRTEAVHRAPMPPDMFGHLNLYGLSSEDAPDSVREGVEASLAAAANSQETVLPVGWELHTNQEGREFFVNLRCAISQWEAPALPPHWEERASREGQVYYLSVFDGRTQWEWPQEHAQTSESRLAITLPPRATLAGMTPQGMAMMLTMPGSLQPPADQDEDDDPQLDVRSDDSTDIDVEGDPADQVDALQLLAVPPGGAGADEGDDEVLGAREEDKPIEKWGEDKLDKQWLGSV